MKSSDVLRHEHILINRMLSVAGETVKRARSGRRLPDKLIEGLMEFFREFVERFHYGKEEGMMFEEMEKAGVFTQQLPIESIKYEHHVGRCYLNRLFAVFEDQSLEGEARFKEIMNQLDGFVELMLSHSRKEDRVLYPLGDRLIDPEGDVRLIKYYSRVDKQFPDYYQKYSRLAEEMERLLKEMDDR